MKSIIVFYSMGGNTAYAAEKTAALTAADLLRIEPVKQFPDKGFRKFFWGGMSAVMSDTPKLQPYSFNAEEYDQVIFGFPVWAGNIAPPLRTFIKEQSTMLKDKKIAAFACQGGSGAEKAFEKLAKCLGISSVDETMILIDPKDRPSEDNEDIIKAFCERLEK